MTQIYKINIIADEKNKLLAIKSISIFLVNYSLKVEGEQIIQIPPFQAASKMVSHLCSDKVKPVPRPTCSIAGASALIQCFKKGNGSEAPLFYLSTCRWQSTSSVDQLATLTVRSSLFSHPSTFKE